MDRLSFALPSFCRHSWTTAAARLAWESRLQKIALALREVEWLSVVAGVRQAAIVRIAAHNIADAIAGWNKWGLKYAPQQPTNLKGADSAAQQLWVLAAREENLSALTGRCEPEDYENAGTLLGYPRCCTEFFRKVSVEGNYADSTWPMAAGTDAAAVGTRCIECDALPWANVLWRWMEVQAVPHLPCHFRCMSTVALGEKLVELAKVSGYAPEMEWMRELLSWPVEWSALHGIAEIKTPILKVTTRTDATPHKYTVRLRAHAFPLEGPAGFGFPHRAAHVTNIIRLSKRNSDEE